MMYIITFNSVWNVHHMRPILMCIVKLYVWTISTAWNADCTHNMQPLIIYIIHNWTDSPMLRAWSIPFPLTFRLHLNLCSTVISLGNIPWAISHTIWADWACVAWHIHSIMWLCARFPCRSACVCVCLCVFANVSFVFCVYVARDFYEWTDVTCVVKLKKKFAGNKYACCLYNRMMWNTTTAKMASIFFLSLLLSWLQYTHIHQQCTTIYMCNVIHNMICAPNGMYIVELCT